MKRRCLVVALTAVVLLATLTPAAAQDAVKAEIRQAIDAACLNPLWNGPDVKGFLAGWDHGALAPMRLMPTGDFAYVAVAELIAFDLQANPKPSGKKEFTSLYPVIDVTGGIAMARVEVMRGETIVNTNYFSLVKTKTGWKVVGFPAYMHQKGARPDIPAGEADAVKKAVEDTLVRGLMQDGSTEQVLAGVGPLHLCDINLYLPALDVVAKLDLTTVFAEKTHLSSMGRKLRPLKSSAFTLIGITGHVAAGKLAVTLDSGTEMTMYVVLFKLKTGWAIVQITTDTHIALVADQRNSR
jgi:hypothetical protein